MKRRNDWITGILTAVIMVTAGCAQTEYTMPTLVQEPYARMVYDTEKVKVGDLTESFELTLSQDEIRRVGYGVTRMDLEPEKVWVSRGDKVKAGQRMVSFHSEELTQDIQSRKEQIKELQMQIELQKEQMKLQPEWDLNGSITRLQRQIEVHERYVQEDEEKLAAYQIVAEQDGTVTKIDEDLESGYLTGMRDLVTVVSGNGHYRGSTWENYPFEVGMVFTADSDGIAYELKLVKATREMNAGASGAWQLIFEPLSDVSALSDSARMTLQIQKETLQQVVYVRKKFVHSSDGRTFVYVLNEKGFVEERFVETGEEVYEYVVITEGLEGGEEVLP